MKKALFALICGVLLAAVPSFAKGGGSSKSNIMRGGFGYIFADMNSFRNSGQVASNKGFAVEAGGTMQNATGGNRMGASASGVFSTGMFGLGGYYSRSGTSLMTSGSFADVAGGEMGFGLVKERLFLGAGFARTMTTGATNNGVVNANLTLLPGKTKGFAMAVGGTTTIGSTTGSETRTAKGALGFAFSPMVSLEAVATLNNLSAMTDWTAGGFINITGQMFYLSGGFNYFALARTSEALGRFGLILGRAFDISAYVDYVTTTGVSPLIGATARIVF